MLRMKVCNGNVVKFLRATSHFDLFLENASLRSFTARPCPVCLCAIDRDNMLFILHMYVVTQTHTSTQWANTVCDCARQLSVTLWP